MGLRKVKIIKLVFNYGNKFQILKGKYTRNKVGISKECRKRSKTRRNSGMKWKWKDKEEGNIID